ncbi:unnamed protein product [Lactuca virosa]|uniref:Uncharacterized protein n=1 Tax=Lactuca virosa TaxID=75947 RepID=A0AAU9N210_9ASTR|nr:unnamed protein product [Lactuca virosa]
MQTSFPILVFPGVIYVPDDDIQQFEGGNRGYLEYTYAQAAYFFSTRARRVRRLKNINVGLGEREKILLGKLASVEKTETALDQLLGLLASKKVVVEEHVIDLEKKVDELSQNNEALNIRIESLKRELVDKEKQIIGLKEANVRLEEDLRCLLKEGVVGVVDKVIELHEFLHGIGRIKNNCWCAGEESGPDGVRKEIVVGTFDAGPARSSSSHNGGMAEDIDAFLSCDYATLLKLGELDLEGLKRLCACEAGGEPGTGGTTKIVGLDDDGDKGKNAI